MPDQLDLFGTQVNPVARSSDPVTSHMAAESIPSASIRERQRAVLDCLEVFGAMTDEEIASVYRGIVQSPSGLRTRRKELARAGYVIDTGEKRKLRSGRLGIVWDINAA